LTARKLGRRAGVLTRAADLAELQAYLQGIALHVVPAEQTTTFENVYGPEGRTQYVRVAAPPIPADAVPPGWDATPVVHLGPVAQEVPAELAGAFSPSTLIGATPQGWLRGWDETGLVRHRPWREAERVLARVGVLIFSAEDVGGDLGLVRQYAEMAPLAVVTDHRNGCVVWEGGRQTRHPAFDVPEVDPTGAGDVFATAFLLRYAETRDSDAAARFANCAASFVVEGHGTSVLPTQEQVEHRLRTGKTRPPT
jgi:hypothetical protein